MNRLTAILFGIALTLTCGVLAAAPIMTFGAGSAVTVADRIATFDSVVTGIDLTAYTEGGLSITVPKFAYTGFVPAPGFSGGFHYPSGGVYAPTVISPTDSAIMYAVEFNIGSGFGDQIGGTGYFAWETLLGGIPTGGGYFTADLSMAQVAGFADLAGFDTLRVANYAGLQEAMGGITPSGYQALAIDNLKVQLRPGEVVIPEPSTLALAGMGVLLLGLLRRRSSSSAS